MYLLLMWKKHYIVQVDNSSVHGQNGGAQMLVRSEMQLAVGLAY